MNVNMTPTPTPTPPPGQGGVEKRRKRCASQGAHTINMVLSLQARIRSHYTFWAAGITSQSCHGKGWHRLEHSITGKISGTTQNLRYWWLIPKHGKRKTTRARGNQNTRRSQNRTIMRVTCLEIHSRNALRMLSKNQTTVWPERRAGVSNQKEDGKWR